MARRQKPPRHRPKAEPHPKAEPRSKAEPHPKAEPVVRSASRARAPRSAEPGAATASPTLAQRRRHRWIAAVVGGAIVVGALAVGGVSLSRVPHSAAANTPSFQVGRTERHGFVLEVGLGGVAGAPAPIVIRGTLESTVLEHAEGRVELAFALREVTFSGSAQATLPGLSEGFQVTLDAAGAPQQLHFPRNAPAGTRKVLSLVATSFVGRVPPTGSPLTVTEHDALGTFDAAYRWEGPNALVREKLRYHSPELTDAGVGIELEIRVIEARRAVSLDAERTLLRSKDDERLELVLGGPGMERVSVTRHATFERQAVGTDLARAQKLRAARGTLEAAPIGQMALSDQAIDQAADRRLVGDRSLSELVGGLTGAASAAPDALHPLAARLRLDPSGLGKLEAQILARDAHATELITAIGLAATEPAQLVLVRLVGARSLAVEQRRAAAEALVLSGTTTVPVLKALEPQLAEHDPELGSVRFLAYGALLNALRESAPEAHRQGVEHLLASLAQTKEPERRLQIIDALGNAGSIAALPALLGAAKDGAEPEQVIAIKALRRIQDPRVEAFLITTLSHSSANVRQATVQCMGMRAIEPFLAGLEQVALHDRAEAVREAALGALGGARRKHPELVRVFSAVLRSEKSPRVRALAARLLAETHRLQTQ